MPTPHPIGHTGHFTIGTNAPGAQHLNAILSSPANGDTVIGHGVLTQTTSPVLHANTAFSGVYHVAVFGAQTTQSFSLHGTAIPPLLGAPHVTQLAISLDGLWGKKGTATYTYVVGSEFHTVKDVPVSVEWLLQG
jgi:hypothetical protein